MCTEELKKQYESGRISFQEYVAQLEANNVQLSNIVLSNRIDNQLYQLNNQRLGKQVSSSKPKRPLTEGDLIGIKSERAVMHRLRSILSCQVIKARNNSGLDAYWKGDLLVVLPGQPMIPIQVKSTAEARRRFNRLMGEKSNRLEIPSQLTGCSQAVYVSSPIVLIPPVSRLQRQLFDQTVLQLREAEELVLVA